MPKLQKEAEGSVEVPETGILDCPQCSQPVRSPLFGDDSRPDENVTDSVPSQPPQPVGESAEKQPVDQWYVHAGDRLLGPCNWPQIKELGQRGVIDETTTIGKSMEGPWHLAGEFPAPSEQHPIFVLLGRSLALPIRGMASAL